MNLLKLELRQRATSPSDLTSDTMHWKTLVQAYRQRLCNPAGFTIGLTLLVTESDPAHFLAATIAAIEAHCPVILGNPQWSESDWQQVMALNVVNAVWGKNPYLLGAPESTTTPLPPGAILIATGGSSGQLRFVHHTWQTLSAAVEGLQRSGLLSNTVRSENCPTARSENLQPDLREEIGAEIPTAHPIHSVCTLPLYHVSGFMQFVRSFLTGGNLIVMPFRSLLSGFQSTETEVHLPNPRCPSPHTLSLVPTQLYRLLHLPSQDQHIAAIDWLRKFQIIFVGGAALHTDLSDRARYYQLPLAPTYGMTETAGMVATLSPLDFLSGNTSVGRSLPHVKIQVNGMNVNGMNNEISNPESMGTAEYQNASDRITLQGKSLALGYYPQAQSSGFALNRFVTNDRGVVDSAGYLYVHGRIDRMIITGGEKVYPDTIEAIVSNTGLVKDIAIIGIPDADWGQKVVAFFVEKTYFANKDCLENGVEKNLADQNISDQNVADQNNLNNPFIESIKTIVNPLLTPPQRPKEWILVDEIPRNDRGKLNPSFPGY